MTETVVEKGLNEEDIRQIESRLEEVFQLEDKLLQANQLLTTMAPQIQLQGEVIERVEFDVSRAADYVRSAKEDTKTAVKYQSKARRKKIFLMVFSVVVVIITGSILLGYFT